MSKHIYSKQVWLRIDMFTVPDAFPVIFWFHRGYNSFIKDPLYLKDYINDLV